MDAQKGQLSCQECTYWKEQCHKESTRLTIKTQRANKEAQRARFLRLKLLDARNGLSELCQRLQDVGTLENESFAQESLISRDLIPPDTDNWLASGNAEQNSKPIDFEPNAESAFSAEEHVTRSLDRPQQSPASDPSTYIFRQKELDDVAETHRALQEIDAKLSQRLDVSKAQAPAFETKESTATQGILSGKKQNLREKRVHSSNLAEDSIAINGKGETAAEKANEFPRRGFEETSRMVLEAQDVGLPLIRLVLQDLRVLKASLENFQKECLAGCQALTHQLYSTLNRLQSITGLDWDGIEISYATMSQEYRSPVIAGSYEDQGAAAEEFRRPVVSLPKAPMLYTNVKRTRQTPAPVRSQSVPEAIPFGDPGQVSSSEEISEADAPLSRDIDNMQICSPSQSNPVPDITDTKTSNIQRNVQRSILGDTASEYINYSTISSINATSKQGSAHQDGPERITARPIENGAPQFKSPPTKESLPIPNPQTRAPMLRTPNPQSEVPILEYVDPQSPPSRKTYVPDPNNELSMLFYRMLTRSSVEQQEKIWRRVESKRKEIAEEIDSMIHARMNPMKRGAPLEDDPSDTFSAANEPPTKRPLVDKKIPRFRGNSRTHSDT